MKTYIEITFSDNTVMTEWFKCSKKEAEEIFKPGEYAKAKGRPRLISESKVICWDEEE